MSQTNNNTESLLRLWASGDLDLTERLGVDNRAAQGEAVERYRPRPHKETFRRGVHRFSRFYKAAAAILCVMFAFVMLLTVSSMPDYGAEDAPTVNEVAQRYVEDGTEETGAVNTVAGMILDYRAFDTLGESFVLFTAVGAVTILMNMAGSKRRIKPDPEIINYAADPIVRTICAFIIPIILVFGVYILLNGHLSPGGGFSGGAILAAAFILYALVWGDKKASSLMSPKRIKIITLCALGFYACSKTYSFYTGANHLHSIIKPGTPGRILSSGLILPLNVAVGFVVCCTMYSFYMYFRRGEL